MFKPLNDRVLVRRLDAETTSPGGIVLPQTGEKPSQGEVVAVGPGALDKQGQRRPVALAPGQRVLFARYGGTELRLNQQDHVVLREDDILGVLE